MLSIFIYHTNNSPGFGLPNRRVTKLAREASEGAKPHTAHTTDINQKSVSRACLMFRKCMRKTMENTTDRIATRKTERGSPERVSGAKWNALGAIEKIYWFALMWNN